MEPSGRNEIGTDQGTEDLGKRSTSRKLKEEIRNCPRPILSMSQFYKLSDKGKVQRLIFLEEQKPKKVFLQTTLKKWLSKISEKRSLWSL